MKNQTKIYPKDCSSNFQNEINFYMRSQSSNVILWVRPKFSELNID